MEQHPPKFGFRTIRTRTILVSIVPLAFLLLLLALALLLQERTVENAAWAAHSEEILTQSEAIGKLIGGANQSAVQYSAKRSDAALAAYGRQSAQLPAALAKLDRLVANEPAQTVRAARVRQASTGAMKIIAEFLAYAKSGDTARQRALESSPRLRRAGAELQNAFAAFNDSQRAMMIVRSNQMRPWVQNLGLALILCSIAGILLSLFVSARFGLNIVERLEALAENARRLAADEPTRPIEGRDEIAALDRVYHEMTRRMQREHHVASTLQRVLLPQELPHISGLRIDTAYVPAAKGAEVGGDWYDVFRISERRICIGVGDVAGHGLRAASVMGTARLAIRTAARIESQPGAILQHVNRILVSDDPDVVVTAFIGMLDLSDGSLTYSIAGHPPPIITGPGGETRFLAGEGLMLGIDRRAKYEQYRTDLTEGAGLVLYTDGIVEAERDYLQGQQNLLAAVRRAYRAPVENIAEDIQRRVFQRAQPRDDCALLFLGVTSLGAPPRSLQHRTWTLDAREESATRRVKRAVLWHLGEIAAPDSDLAAVELILGELVGNVARHTPGHAEIAIAREDGCAVLYVTDGGAPFTPSIAVPDLLAESGRGLFLVRALSSDVRITHTGSGNRISVTLPVHITPEGQTSMPSAQQMRLGVGS